MSEHFPTFAPMKARYILILIAVTLIVPAWLVSCGEDRWAGYAEQTKTDRWIDDTMRVWYYWREDIPNTNSLNYFTDPISFFKSLLSSEDGKGGVPYSTIDTLEPVTRSIPYTDYSYGFQFTTNRVENNDTALYAHILYVAKGSPADDIGLQRGDWIMQMDGQPITQKNYTKLYGSTGMEITVGYYDAGNDTILPYDKSSYLASACTIDDNPVHYRNVYERAGKRIGYLVYNHFSSGSTEGINSTGTEYDDDLRRAFQDFSSRQVNEFVLDLRYNNGGQLSCAVLLCAMLAPSSALGQTLGYLEYNSLRSPRQAAFALTQDVIGDGANLNLSTLYVLTSSQTASASEMLINCLKPYMNVVLIGETTEGKNVGSTSFINEEIRVKMQPIVCKIYNSLSESDYENGFTADYSVSENSDQARFLPFGNENELLLYTALGLIDGSLQQTEEARLTSSLRVVPLNSSIARRACGAVSIDR